MGAGTAAAALTFAVPAARMLGSDRGRRRLGSRLGVRAAWGQQSTRACGCADVWHVSEPLESGSRGAKGRTHLHDRSSPAAALLQGVFDGIGRLFDFRGGFKLSSALYAGQRRVHHHCGGPPACPPSSRKAPEARWLRFMPDR